MLEISEMIILGCAIVFCFMMTWGVGANDLANVMSPTMGSKSISVKQALLTAIVFETMGALLGGSGVTETLRDGIIDISQLVDENPTLIIRGMLAILLAGTIWMNLASYLGLPVSITNAIVGSMVGLGVTVFGFNAIHWHQVGYIAASWISSPLLACITAYLLMISIQILIFGKHDPIAKAKLYLPIYLFLAGLVLSFITVIKGFNHFNIKFTPPYRLMVMIISGCIISFAGMQLVNRIDIGPTKKRRQRFLIVERQFAVLVGFTTCAMVFAHGANDVSIAVGPLTTIYSLMHHVHAFDASTFPRWITLLGCLGVMSGLFFYGRKVIETVGSSITALTPSRAFAATIAAATTVVLSTSTGLPVSATQTLVGAILGVGLARGIGALNLIVIRNIFMSWIFTLPASCLLTIGCFHGLKLLF